MITLPVTPVPKPRMTRADKWSKRPAVEKYWSFKDKLCLAANLAGFELGESFRVVFQIPMPDGWSRTKRQRMVGKPHQVRPDTDNLTKAVMDSLLPDGDARVWHVDAKKVWGITGAIMIENLEERQ